jgi:DnaJ-class molecular chaperone
MSDVKCKKCKGTGEHRRGEKCGTCKGSGFVVVTVDKDGNKTITAAVRS